MFVHRGEGLFNFLLNKLPVELHIPGGYNYCGPGTHLEKRLARGDSGINPLDSACKEHDIAYHQHKDLVNRHRADRVLEERARERVKSKDAALGEKAAAWVVVNAMKTKRKLGMGCGGTRKVVLGRGILKDALKEVKKSKGTTRDVIKRALAAAKRSIKKIGGKRNVKLPRIIPVPKRGGIIPFLIPLFAGLSAAGAISGGVSGIVNAINKAKNAKRQLEENGRHNRIIEAIALGKQGHALYLKPYKTGSALFLKPYSKN